MKRLTLLRHAKSGWDDPVARDFDRPLNERGKRGAALMGTFAKRQNLDIDYILASPAVRVTETLDEFLPAAGLDDIEPHLDRRIYLASSATLLDCLRDLPDSADHVLMCGHNPGMEDLILDLVPDDGASPLRDQVEIKFPTAALGSMTIGIDSWKDVDQNRARLTQLTRPRDLDAALGPEMDD
jgi:phosphohistidine phosphatase